VLVELASPHHEAVLREGAEAALSAAVDAGEAVDVVVAKSEIEARTLWQLREAIPLAQGVEGLNIKHDIGVPLSSLAAFVDASDELPFARPLPRFPVPCAPLPVPSFAAAGRAAAGGMRHVPDWLPAFPDPHTYVRTEVWSEQAARDRVDMVEQVRQRRKAEKSLLSLQQRLALAGADGFRPAISDHTPTPKGKEIQLAGTKRNPFLEPALPPGDNNVPELDIPPERKKLSILEAFAPAIQGADAMDIDSGTGWDQGQNRKSIVPKERAPVRLKIGIDRKPLAAALNSQSVDLREDPSFLKEEIKDDRKRRAGMILRASMENPQELPQL
jgi:transcription initiation factor TFIID subunit 8